MGANTQKKATGSARPATTKKGTKRSPLQSTARKCGPPTSKPEQQHKANPNQPTQLDHAIELEIRSIMHSLLSKLRSSSSTICPSQVARKLHENDPPTYPDWRALMDPVREVVWKYVKKGWVEVTQGGEVRGLEEREGLRGPIRVRKGVRFGEYDSGLVDDG